MRRLKSLDIFRGIAMVYMIVGHAITWWPVPEDRWILLGYVSLFSSLGAIGFVFISGISTMIAYKNRIVKSKLPERNAHLFIRKEFLTRGLFILILGLVYNIFVAIIFMDPLAIWKWFIMLTIGACMMMSWPFLKMSKSLRIIVGAIFWILNQVAQFFLEPFAGEFNFPGVLYFLLYNSPDQNIILSFFTVFLLGTVFGELIYEVFSIEDVEERRHVIKTKFLYPSLIVGSIMIIFGYIYVSPIFFTEEIMEIKPNFWWLLYSCGIEIILITSFITFEEYHQFKSKKSYRFLYYFSYYSLTAFVIQNVDYFFFYQSLNRYNIWFFLVLLVVIYGIFLRFMYKKLGDKFSLKIQVSRLANGVANRVGLTLEELYAKYSPKVNQN